MFYFLFSIFLLGKNQKVALLIIDGLGENAWDETNAIYQAHTPNFDHYKKIFPYTTLVSSQQPVGLVSGEPGSSSVGHQTLGLGRTIPSYLRMLEKSLQPNTNYSLRTNPLVVDSLNFSSNNNGTLHLFGSCTKEGIFANIKYLKSFFYAAKDFQMKEVFIHCSFWAINQPIEEYINELERMAPNGLSVKVVSVHSSDEAMDRSGNWTKTGITYSSLFNISKAKTMKLEDFLPIVPNNTFPIFPVTYFEPSINHQVKENDTLILFNFREDRSYQIAASLLKGPQFLAYKEYKQKSTSFLNDNIQNLKNDPPFKN